MKAWLLAQFIACRKKFRKCHSLAASCRQGRQLCPTKPNTELMKPKIITTLLSLSLMSSSMARAAEGISRDTLDTNKLTQVWTNVDETKTRRADSRDCTSVDTRSAQSVPGMSQLKQNLTVLVIGAVVAALYEWWSIPQPVMININR